MKIATLLQFSILRAMRREGLFRQPVLCSLLLRPGRTGAARITVSDGHADQRDDRARQEHGERRQVQPAGRRHVRRAEGGIVRQHVQHAKADAGEPLAPSAVAVPADQQGDDKSSPAARPTGT